MLKKINMGRKSTSSHWQILFRKVRLCKLTLSGAELYQPGLNLRPAMKLRKVFTMGKIKSSFKARLIPFANKLAPGPVNSNTKSKP